MDSRKSGVMCSVRGCHNNWQKLNLFLEQECFDHRVARNECGCEAPYDLHPPPKDEESLRLWLKALNLKKPPKRPYVCSYHFVDKRPTQEHPFPEKWLGYDAPVQKKRRLLIRTSTHEDDADAEVDLSVTLPTHKDAETQWELPALTDHSYTSQLPVNQPTCHKPTQPVAHTILKNDSSSVLYTGLPLSVFFAHVAYLKQFYTANFKMHVADQILITLMKLKLNLLQCDLAERFDVSQGVVSRILSYWIDTMEEHMRIYIPWLWLFT